MSEKMGRAACYYCSVSRVDEAAITKITNTQAARDDHPN